MSDRVDLIITKAVDLANQYSHEYVTLEHLASAMFVDEDIKNLVKKFNADPVEIMKEFNDHIENDNSHVYSNRTIKNYAPENLGEEPSHKSKKQQKQSKAKQKLRHK